MSGSGLKAGEVYYWVEPVSLEGFSLSLMTAVTGEGLLLVSLGKAEEKTRELTGLVKRFLPGSRIIAKREPNEQAFREIQEYLEGKRKEFALKLHLTGTDFQKKVWQEMLKIPYGETRSYSEIALSIGCRKGQRAVGMAANKNPLGIVVPCHRVIGKDGSLVGYAGGLELKRILLKIEKGKELKGKELRGKII